MKARVYTVQPGAWLTFTDEKGVCDGYDARKPLDMVSLADYNTLLVYARRLAGAAAQQPPAITEAITFINALS